MFLNKMSTFNYFAVSKIASLVSRFLDSTDFINLANLLHYYFPLLNIIQPDTELILLDDFTDRQLEQILYMTNTLRNLCVKGCKITSSNLSLLSQFTNLTSLSIKNINRVTDGNSYIFLHTLTKLEQLEINDCNNIINSASLSTTLSEVKIDSSTIYPHMLSAIFNLPGLDTLELSNIWIMRNHASELTNIYLSELYNSTSLTSLSLSRSTLLDEYCLSSLVSLTNLTSLTINTCSSFSSVNILSSLTSLTELKLQHLPSLTDRGIFKLGNLTNLIKLNLQGCSRLTNITLHIICKLNNITFLQLSNTQIDDLTPLTQLNKLSILLINECKNVIDPSVRYLSELTSLSILDISNCGVTCAVMAKICKLTKLHTLRMDSDNYINLSSILCAVSFLTNLTYLSFNCIDLDNYNLESIANLTKLTVLNLGVLQNSHYNDKGLSYLARLSDLRELALFGNKNITSKGIKCLIVLGKLVRLDIHKCTKVRDETVDILGKMESLNLVDISYSGITENGKDMLKILYPRIKIV